MIVPASQTRTLFPFSFFFPLLSAYTDESVYMLLAQQSAKGNCICWALVLPQHFPDVYRIRAGGDDIRSEVKISFGFG